MTKQQVEYIRGTLPHETSQQIFLMLIETDRINGVMAKDPFKFENATVKKITLGQNGDRMGND